MRQPKVIGMSAKEIANLNKPFHDNAPNPFAVDKRRLNSMSPIGLPVTCGRRGLLGWLVGLAIVLYSCTSRHH
jgi:hypothetical protein